MQKSHLRLTDPDDIEVEHRTLKVEAANGEIAYLSYEKRNRVLPQCKTRVGTTPIPLYLSSDRFRTTTQSLERINEVLVAARPAILFDDRQNLVNESIGSLSEIRSYLNRDCGYCVLEVEHFIQNGAALDHGDGTDDGFVPQRPAQAHREESPEESY